MSVKFRRSLLLAAGALLAVTAVAVPVVVNTASAQNVVTGSGNQPRIVGGNQASLAEHPYAVFLEDTGGNQYCGAVIVSSSSFATSPARPTGRFSSPIRTENAPPHQATSRSSSKANRSVPRIASRPAAFSSLPANTFATRIA